MAYDRGIADRRFHIRVGERRHHLGNEVAEDAPVSVPFAQDRRPAQSGLRALEGEQFEESAVVADRHAPFRVVVTEFGLRQSPRAAL